MKKIAILLCFIALIIHKSHAQSACTNSDFSAGSFADWTGSYGENDGTTTGLGYTVKVNSLKICNGKSSSSASGPYFRP